MALAAVVLATTAVAVAGVSAHRRDEYLQAARIAIDPNRVELELDLTPGITLAGVVIGELDRDRDGRVSSDEARAYAALVEHDTRLEVDGRVLPVWLVDARPPTVEAMLGGEGTLGLHWAASLPALSPGPHRLRFSNAHHRDIGVYLANVLVPASDRIAVTGQERDVEQREFTVDFEVTGNRAGDRAVTALTIAGCCAVVAVLGRRRFAASVTSVRRAARPPNS